MYRNISIQCIYNTKANSGGYKRRWREWNEVEVGERVALASPSTYYTDVTRHIIITWWSQRCFLGAQPAFGEPILPVKVSELGRLEGASAQGITILNLQLIKLNCKGDPDILQGLGRSATFRQWGVAT